MEGQRSAERHSRFIVLASPHMSAMLHTAAALIGWADAEDAVQEALVRGMLAWPTLREPAALRGWLLRITFNVCADWQRGRLGVQRRQTQMPPDNAVELPAPLALAPGSAEHAARLDLRQAIDALPQDQRLAVILRYYVGLDATEISAATGQPSATVRSHLHRARAALRVALALPEATAITRSEKRRNDHV
jgi:RNA polymerase sigma-70 factor (ECF subfamily)